MMVNSAWSMALLIAICVAILAISFLSFINTDATGLLPAGIICFSATYLFTFVALEFLVFREIKTLYKMMEKLKKKEWKGSIQQKPGKLNALKNINEEIFSFAALKQNEIDELKKMEAYRKEFVANVSHELKTPIFAAQGFVHTLLDGAIHDKQVRKKFLKKAAKSLDGLDALVQDLLTLSKMETGDIKMKFEYIDLNKLCREVVDQFEEKAAKKNIRLRLGKADQKVMVYADWKRITQVVTNLVSNAIHYTPGDGSVSVKFEMGKKNVTTFVRDTGAGIPPEHLTRIFERFYRVDKSRSREKGGTGLGLAIVRHILEGHGSRPEVESTPGKGSVFSFKLPRAKPDNNSAANGS